VVALAASASIGAACRSAPTAYGEALVVLSTDVVVPQHLSRVRVDFLDGRGEPFDTRELPTPSALDWPLSFSVVSDTETEDRTVTLRIRGFPEGHTESALTPIAVVPDGGWREPRSYDALSDACTNAPKLAVGDTVTLRRGPLPLTTIKPQSTPNGTFCTQPVTSGSAAFAVEITTPGVYDFTLLSSVPDPARGGGGRTALVVRKACADATTQLACNDAVPPKVTVTLDPGTYWLVTAGTDAALADLTLRVSEHNAISSAPSPTVDAGAAVEGAVVPAHGVTIERLVPLRLQPGKRGTVEVVLHGDCFGVPADRAGRRACVDRGVPEVIDEIVPDGPLSRGGSVNVGSWAAEATESCTVSPRSPSPLRDEERCIPGGAFILGDTLALSYGPYRSRPERMRVVAPFLMDVYEVSVARYRDALRRGFVPKLAATVQNRLLTQDAACTFNQAAGSLDPAPGIDREAYPLTCVDWETAQDLCRFLGGDLPAEDQWEYAATAAGRPVETSYPWGNAVPSCSDAVIGRVVTGVAVNDACARLPVGPTAVDDPSWASADHSPAGIVGLAGNVREWLADGFLGYDHPAWEGAGLRAPLPRQARAPLRGTRGSSWANNLPPATGSTRNAESSSFGYTDVGLRCVRPGR
jgi:formylglycine-generating enzyme required for sulfatase activity